MGLTKDTSSWHWTDRLLCKTPPWITHVGDIFYDFWQCIYEPLFWFMYLLSCTWESHQQQKQRYFDDMMTFSANDDDDDGFYMPLATTTITAATTTTVPNTTLHHRSMAATRATTKNRKQDASNNDDDDMRIFRYSKSYIKQALMAHLKTIRQKQRILNGVMKRSLLRRAKRMILIQPPPPAPPSPSIVIVSTVQQKSVSPSLIVHKTALSSKRNYCPIIPPPLQHHRSKKFGSTPLSPLKTLAHRGNITPEIVSLSNSLMTF